VKNINLDGWRKIGVLIEKNRKRTVDAHTANKLGKGQKNEKIIHATGRVKR
jgi:hypothetical protein